MLVLKVCVNTRQIDEIHIQNVGVVDKESDIWKYKIRKPNGYDKKVFHNVRKNGYEELVSNILGYIAKGKRSDKMIDKFGV